MAADRFSQCLGNICGKFLGDNLEDIITDAYPRLKSDTELRHRYAEYLESLNVTDSYNSICALSKIAYATKKADHQIPELQSDPEQVVERLLPAVKTMANTLLETIENPDNPLVQNILMDNKGYLFSQTLYINDSNAQYNTRKEAAEAKEIAQQVASCVIGKDLTDFIKIIEENADISAKSMMLIGNLHPQFQQLAAVKDPEIADFCKLAATFPRSTFVACIDMKSNDEPIKDFASFLQKVSSPEVIEKAKFLNKEKADAMFRASDMTKPASPNLSPKKTPQNISGNERE
ncbi:MAG: hypothetical protein J6N49_02220 [Alphaproteobacteria bacterium]|nr:hypothetical protein [Alphaproteobacteria bacterium]